MGAHQVRPSLRFHARAYADEHSRTVGRSAGVFAAAGRGVPLHRSQACAPCRRRKAYNAHDLRCTAPPAGQIQCRGFGGFILPMPTLIRHIDRLSPCLRLRRFRRAASRVIWHSLPSTRNAAHTRREHLVLRWHAVAEDQVFIAIDKTKCTKESECKTEAAKGFSGSHMWVL